MPLLRELGMRHGFEVIIIPPVMYRGEVVSSTVIRREIAAGNVTHASLLLGRPFTLTGEVVSGTGTGRRFTFPTLNLVPEQELLPARGVYVTRTVLEGSDRTYRSVTNVGTRPTFNGSSLTVETHLLDFSGQIEAQAHRSSASGSACAERRSSPAPKNSALRSRKTLPAPTDSSRASAASGRCGSRWCLAQVRLRTAEIA